VSGAQLRVLRGGPTPEELAALTAVLAATARRTGAAPRTPPGRWKDPATPLRTDWPQQRSGAWHTSAR
jgi:hypothetical protein